MIPFLSKNYDVRPHGIIHVGANVGQEVPIYSQSGVAPAILIEPLDEPFRKLTAAIHRLKDYIAVQACLAGESGRTVDFYVANNEGASSSFLKPSGHLTIAPGIKFPETLKMKTRTLDEVVDEVCARHGFAAADLDYLAIDTQGTELDILRGGPATLAHVNFAFIEVSLVEIYEGGCTMYEVIDFMREQGFGPYFVKMVKAGWGNALFIRNGVVKKRAI